LGIHPEVVEAACLAHDLGHPPFGHCGEETLNNLVSRHDDEGFEGNAQSFRILTKLAVRFDNYPGLDLTRATLAACLKYSWFRDRDGHSRKTTKWGAYRTDSEDFTFARFNIDDDESKTAEAELMDWADDIAYSVHDIEDFHRCNAIPWREILSEEGRNKLVESAAGKNEKDKSKNTASLEQAHANLKSLIEGTAGNLINEPYEARQDQRRLIRVMTSQLIGHFVTSTRVRVPGGTNRA
jgi:dGTPase